MIDGINKGVRVTVAAIIEKDGNILLIKRNTEPFKGYWSLPGGHIDFGEGAKQAIVREVKEETGLKFTPNFITYRDEIYPEKNWHAEVLIFTGQAQGKESFDKNEIIDLRWIKAEEVIKMKLAFGHEKSVGMYKKMGG